MNILKILVILAISMSGVAFAQAAVRAGSTSDVSATSAQVETTVKTTAVEEPDFGVTSAEPKPETTGIEHEDIGVTGGDDDSDGDGLDDSTEDIEFTLNPDRVEGRIDDDSDDIKDDSDDEKGNVETEFKVEEGEKAEGDGHEDEIDILGTSAESNSASDSFFDVFFDFGDEDTQEAVSAFLKLGDIKGESSDEATEDNDNDGVDNISSPENTQNIQGSKASKPKEIVVVGSKVRKKVQESKVEVRGWDPEKKEVTIKPDDIEEGEDFLDLVGATVLSDENIESVAITPEEIKMEYSQPAKLFGFIPMSLTAQVVLSEKAEVKVKFPWYRIFTSDNAKEVKKEIDVLSLSWGAVINETDTEFLRDRASRFQTISNMLKAAHDTASNSIRNMK